MTKDLSIAEYRRKEAAGTLTDDERREMEEAVRAVVDEVRRYWSSAMDGVADGLHRYPSLMDEAADAATRYWSSLTPDQMAMLDALEEIEKRDPAAARALGRLTPSSVHAIAIEYERARQRQRAKKKRQKRGRVLRRNSCSVAYDVCSRTSRGSPQRRCVRNSRAAAG